MENRLDLLTLTTIARNGIAFRRPTVSVVIPTLNEAKNLPLVLPYLPLDWIDEVVLVDGRSVDGTVEVAKKLLPSIHIVLETRRGKGVALTAGYRASYGDIIVVLDADGSNDPREIPRFVISLVEGADFVKGSRFAPGGGTTDMPRIRKWGNGVFVYLTNLLFGSKFTDLCYGYHAFWRYCLDEVNLVDANGFEIDASLYLQAIAKRLRIMEVPSFEGYRFYGEGKLRTFPDGWRVLGTIKHEWFNAIRRPQQDYYIGFRGLSPANSSPEKFQGHGLPPVSINVAQLLPHDSGRLSDWEEMRLLLQDILKRALESLEAISGSIIVLNDKGEVWEACLVYRGQVHQPESPVFAEIVKQGLAGWVLEHNEPALIPSTQSDPRWLARQWDQEQEPRTAVAIPLVSREQAVGVLTLTRSNINQFTPADLKTLAQLGL